MYSLSVPSKTFLAGEYLALKGGPVLLLQTEPRFVLEVKKTNSKSQNPFHPKSAAGQFWQHNENQLLQYEFAFRDPHAGKGGFGGSSAEFLLLKSFVDLLQALASGSELDLDLKALLETYWDLEYHLDFKPSGADIVGQRVGGLLVFNRKDGLLKKLSWPFADFDFRLIHTGQKLATHDHLQSLVQTDLTVLEEKVQNLIQGIESVDPGAFVSGVESVAMELENLGFLAEHSKLILQKIRQELPVLAAKGCGAMGNDVLFVLFKKSEQELIDTWLREKSFYFVGSREKISGGLEVKEKELAK